VALSLEHAIGQQFLLSFAGKEAPPREVMEALERRQMGGVVLFRAKNMGSLAELRGLSTALQAAAIKAGQGPLLIAADQEGGQLMAIGDGTPFPGNMALGATRDDRLAYQVGLALGREVAAVGVNVDFAPVCDVNNNPDNPVVGTRSFGEDPALVARLGVAMIRGIQSAGVAACAKHFPGHGDTASDSHHGAPVIPHDARRLARVELPPFRAAVKAGVRLVMTAHIALPALNAGLDRPATLSQEVLRGLLRRRLRYRGLIVTDAMDMKAIDQGAGLTVDTIAAVAAGVDLLLFNHDPPRREAAYAALLQAARRGLLSSSEIQASGRRIMALKRWLGGREQPSLDTVGCQAHRALAQAVARSSVTLVRDHDRRLPLRLPAGTRVAVVVPRPEDLTPADTSSYLVPGLAAAMRRHHPRTDESLVSMSPAAGDIGPLAAALTAYDLVVVGTINATSHPGQAALVNVLVDRGTPTIAVALRMPYDLRAYPKVRTYACTYGILPPSMEALAEALFGRIPFAGRLPVSLPRRLVTRG
jgi:beta-N-acetylhexosaminidase